MARILIIDDETPLRSVIAQTLTAVGHTIFEAADGRLGLERLSVEPVDLVITDLVMPEQDGIETISVLRHLHPGLPIIAMSGDPRHTVLCLEIATRLGVRRALVKPFSADALLHAVDEALERIRAA